MALRRGDYQCAVCGLIFASDQAFQAHRVGLWDNRRCLDIDAILTARRKDGSIRFERDPFGRWREIRKVPEPTLARACP